MTRTDNVYELPPDLPVPVDDGACNHLMGMRLPAVALASTRGDKIDLSKLAGTLVIYCYPRTGDPNEDPPPGWDAIPGARGCTPQSCAFRDHHQQLQALNAEVYGLSTQMSAYQKEMATRLHLPFAVLSDAELKFTRALRLPIFTVQSMVLIKRLTLIVTDGVIKKVFYPVFPPNANPDQVITWLGENPG